jgi:hypothetical protein
VALAGIFVQIGLVPNTDWLKGTVALSNRGEIEVDDRGRRIGAGVFAPATAPPCRTSRSSSRWAKVEGGAERLRPPDPVTRSGKSTGRRLK